ncbi:MAG TPA: nucleotidyltransferase family protein [Blastocatellia bacterium]|nr:nucleotidyltransferase family protein [Blastocatellia bacterium]
MVSAILLAAGESRRMGSFKQLLTLRGKTFVECCVDNLLASQAGEVVVVTGHREAEVRAALVSRPVRFGHNANYRAGMTSSIKHGISVISDTARACLIALVDQPQIGTDVFNLVIETYLTKEPLIVVPTYEGRRGHPIVLDLKLKAEILDTDPNEGLRQVVNSHRDQTIAVEVPSGTVLFDYDTPEDYRRVSDQDES